MTLELLLPLGLLLGLGAWLALSRMAVRIDLLDPLYGAVALFLLFFGLRPAALALGLTEPRTPISLAVLSPAVFWYGVVGLSAFGLGYYARLGWLLAQRLPVPRRRPRRWGMELAAAVALALVAVALLMAARRVPGGLAAALSSPIAIQYALKSGGSYILLAMSAVAYAAWAGLGRTSFDRQVPRRAKWLTWGLFVAAIGVGYLSGLRANVITQVLVLLGLWHYSGRLRLRFRHAMLLGAVGVVAVGGLNALRHYGLGRTSELLGTVFSPDFIVAQTLSVLSPFDGAAFVYQAVSQGALDVLYGSPLLGLIVAPIPRAIWPSKPVISTNWMLVEAMGLDPYSNPISTMTMAGDLFWQFSFPGVIAGMFVLGLAYRLLYEYRNAHSLNSGANVIYLAFYFYSLNAFRTSLVTWIVGILTTSALLALTFWLVTGFAKGLSQPGEAARPDGTCASRHRPFLPLWRRSPVPGRGIR